MGRQGFNASSDEKLILLIRLRGCPDCFESSLYAHANLYLMLHIGPKSERFFIELVKCHYLFVSRFM